MDFNGEKNADVRSKAIRVSLVKLALIIGIPVLAYSALKWNDARLVRKAAIAASVYPNLCAMPDMRDLRQVCVGRPIKPAEANSYVVKLDGMPLYTRINTWAISGGESCQVPVGTVIKSDMVKLELSQDSVWGVMPNLPQGCEKLRNKQVRISALDMTSDEPMPSRPMSSSSQVQRMQRLVV